MRIIFTNGCFDVLHVGHVRLLNFCKKQGDKLIVGLNSDYSVKLLKGEDRPFNTQEDRKEILESLSAVDEVIIFDDLTPYELIKQIQPSLIVKGGDYSSNEVVGSDISPVLIFNFIPDRSSTAVIDKIKHEKNFINR